jgi:hypothetical protein
MASEKPHISSRDPTQLFQLIQQIGSGSYGTVQKVFWAWSVDVRR